MFVFQTQVKKSERSTLYSIVFGSVYVKFAVSLLFVFMLLQPVAQVYAATEGEAATSSQESTAEEAPKEEVEEASASEPEPETETVDETDTEKKEQNETVEGSDTEAAESESESDSSKEQSGVGEGGDVSSSAESEVSSEDETIKNEAGAEEVEDTGEEVTESEVADKSSTTAEEAEEVSSESVDKSTSSDESVTTEESSATSSSSTTGDIAGAATSTEEVDSSDGDSTSGGNSGVESNSGTTSTTTQETDADTDTATTSASSTEEAANVNTEEETEVDEATTTEETEPEVVEEEIADEVDDLVKNNLDRGDKGTSSQEVAGVSTTTTPEPQFYKDMETDPLHFNDSQCVAVADGSYYCSKDVKKAKTEVGSAVYAQRDIDGDNEIFFTDGKDVKQITDNLMEDLSPAYDPVTETIVWHRLQNGRYQIMEYNLKTDEMKQLTSTSYNNMEPAHESGVTVWQAWLGDNWEIVMFDGSTTTQITNNTTHDIAPDIQGDYVIWQTSNSKEGKGAAVYEISTGLTSVIDDSTEGQIVNPRFVLVYDTKFGNGDVVTKGFDPATGDVVPLSAQPSDEPPKIPSPEPTGETQALVQSKSPSGRDELVEEISINSTSTASTSSATGSSTDPINTASSTTSSSTESAEIDTLDMKEEAASSTEETLPLTDYDLIVEPFSSSSSAQVDNSSSSPSEVE